MQEINLNSAVDQDAIQTTTERYLNDLLALSMDQEKLSEIQMILEQYTGREYQLSKKTVKSDHSSTENLTPALLKLARHICEKVLLGLEEYNDDGDIEYHMTESVCFCLTPHYYRQLKKLYRKADGIISTIADHLYDGLFKEESCYIDGGELVFSLDTEEYMELQNFVNPGTNIIQKAEKCETLGSLTLEDIKTGLSNDGDLYHSVEHKRVAQVAYNTATETTVVIRLEEQIDAMKANIADLYFKGKNILQSEDSDSLDKGLEAPENKTINQPHIVFDDDSFLYKQTQKTANIQI